MLCLQGDDDVTAQFDSPRMKVAEAVMSRLLMKDLRVKTLAVTNVLLHVYCCTRYTADQLQTQTRTH